MTNSRKGDVAKKTGTKRVHSKDADMGVALRSVYQQMVDESVPPEMMDLLGKLG